MDNFRIVCFDRDKLSLQVVSYHKTEKEAIRELKRMAKAKECEKHLLYYIQELKPSPVKDPEDRKKFLEEIKKEIN